MYKLLKEMRIRNDRMGSGYYQASRGNRKHAGVDYITSPGEEVYMPFDGKLVREARPYPGDYIITGCLLQGENYGLKIFYMVPNFELVGKDLKVGTVIGVTQDIRVKYGSAMTPHIHVELVHANVDKLFGI